MWPLQDSFTAPLYAVGLGPLFAGLLLGGLWGWLSSFSSKIEVRRLNKKVGSLSEKIGDMEKSAVLEKIKTKTKTSFWSRE